jgi:hypothetical protein
MTMKIIKWPVSGDLSLCVCDIILSKTNKLFPAHMIL